MQILKLPGFLQKIISKILSSKMWTRIVSTNLRLKGYPSFNMADYFEIRDIIRKDPGSLYMFVGSDTANLSLKIQRKMLEVKWAHSGFLELGKDDEIYASHVRYTGYRYYPLIRYLKEIDEFAVIKLRYPDIENENTAKARYHKMKNSNVRYSLAENMQSRKQYGCNPLAWDEPFLCYCSEYQYVVSMGLIDSHWKEGKKQFTPDDVYNGGRVVFERLKDK